MWGFHRNGNTVEEDERAELTSEYEGEMGTLGPVHLHMPSPASALDCGKVVLEGLGTLYYIIYYISYIILLIKDR